MSKALDLIKEKVDGTVYEGLDMESMMRYCISDYEEYLDKQFLTKLLVALVEEL